MAFQTPRPARRTLIITASLLVALVVLALTALVINRPWFDERLLPELAALKTPRVISMEGNGYVLAFGFPAAQATSMRLAGQQILEALQTKFEHGQRIELSPKELQSFLGGPTDDEDWQTRHESLSCSPRVRLDCGELLTADVAQIDFIHPRLNTLLDRYEEILEQPRFDESQVRDVRSPTPPYRLLMYVGRIRLAISYRTDSTPAFLDMVAKDFAFWRRVLRDSDTLPTKMVSLAGMQYGLDFLSMLLRQRDLDESARGKIQELMHPLTSEESDIGEAFVSEARLAVLSDTPPIYASSSSFMKLFTQKNATLNEEYATVFTPMRQRAALGAHEYYAQEAYENLPYRFSLWNPPLYNVGGKMARKKMWNDPSAFISRVHDNNGRIMLVLLQTELEGRQGSTSVSELVESSGYRNPYTNEPMEYDAEAKTIGFKCMHTVFHPPNPPDVCAVLIGA